MLRPQRDAQFFQHVRGHRVRAEADAARRASQSQRCSRCRRRCSGSIAGCERRRSASPPANPFPSVDVDAVRRDGARAEDFELLQALDNAFAATAAAPNPDRFAPRRRGCESRCASHWPRVAAFSIVASEIVNDACKPKSALTCESFCCWQRWMNQAFSAKPSWRCARRRGRKVRSRGRRASRFRARPVRSRPASQRLRAGWHDDQSASSCRGGWSRATQSARCSSNPPWSARDPAATRGS